MKTIDVKGNTVPVGEEKEYRALCGVCRRAPSALEAQEKLLASREKTITVCACKLGSYIIELDISIPNCLRLVHTYQMHAKQAADADSRGI